MKSILSDTIIAKAYKYHDYRAMMLKSPTNCPQCQSEYGQVLRINEHGRRVIWCGNCHTTFEEREQKAA